MSITWKLEDFAPKKYIDLENPTFGLCTHLRSLRRRVKAVLPENLDGHIYVDHLLAVQVMILTDLSIFREVHAKELEETGKQVRLGYGGLTEFGVLRDCYTAMESIWRNVDGLQSPASLFAILATEKMRQAEWLLVTKDAHLSPEEDFLGHPAATRYALAGDAVVEAIEAVAYAEYLLQQEPMIGRTDSLTPQEVTTDSEQKDNVFSECDTYWTIRVQGGDPIRLDKNGIGRLEGLYAIREILHSYSPIPVPVYQIYYAMTARSPRPGLPALPPSSEPDQDQEERTQDNSSDSASSSVGSSQPKIDEKALGEYWTRYKKLSAELSKMKERQSERDRPDDAARLQELESEHRFIRSTLIETTIWKTRKVRNFPTDDTRCGRAVGAAIKRVYDELFPQEEGILLQKDEIDLQKHEILYKYLKVNLYDINGENPYYIGAGRVKWNCEPNVGLDT